MHKFRLFPSLLSFILFVIADCSWHWTPDGVRNDQSSQSEIDWAALPSSFSSSDTRTYARRASVPAVVTPTIVPSVSPKREAARRETAKHEAEKHEAAKHEAAKHEAAKHEAGEREAVEYGAAKHEKVSIRYWDAPSDSFKVLDVPAYRSDSNGDIASRAAEMTEGVVDPEVARLYLEGAPHHRRAGVDLRSLPRVTTTQHPTPVPSAQRVYPIRFWSSKFARWTILHVAIDGKDTVQDVTTKAIKKSKGELNSSALLYLDEIEMPRQKPFNFWINEVQNGGVLEAENYYEPKKPRNAFAN